MRIATANVELGADFVRLHEGTVPGRYVSLSVQDNGCGMTPEVLAHAFEPFFTTKAARRGTGLGLATVYGIVKHSGGCIVIDTEPGKGTNVTAYLPSVCDEAVPGLVQPDGGRTLAGTEHTAPFDAIAHVLDGEALITIAGTAVSVKTGEMVLMPANAPHASPRRSG